jgi:acyl-CoA synthetase (NDP forming)
MVEHEGTGATGASSGRDRARLRQMLEARTVAVVGASDRPDSFGRRMTTEVLRSPGVEQAWLVNPGRGQVLGRPTVPSLADVPGSVDLVLLGVADRALPELVGLASARGDAGAVVFGAAHGVRDEVTSAAAGLELCGGGCMGFVNAVHGVRAIGYLEPDPVPVGPIALVTHSGSVFSALLRTHRRLEYSLAVSSGQELVTTTADYLAYALSLPETRVVGLVLETVRDAAGLRAALAEAAACDVPVVALTVGGSARGRALVDAHSGALAGSDAAWEALFSAYGVHRVDGLDELVDSLECFAVGRRVRDPAAGIATVHDSGAERVLTVDVAERLGVPFAPLATTTVERLGSLLEPGLEPTNPLDMWGSGHDSEDQLARCLTALADDPGVCAVALAVDLVEEYDGDDSYPKALARLVDQTDKPVAVLSHLGAAVDRSLAADLRARGIPVLEGTRSGLRALGHLRDHATRPRPIGVRVDAARRGRWLERLAAGAVDPFDLLADYGVPAVPRRTVRDARAAVDVADALGYPVVLKTGDPSVHHKVDVDGVRLGLADADAVREAYADLAGRLGPAVVVQAQAPPGVEVALGLWRDPLVGPLVLVAAGGTLVELLGERSVALPPVAPETAAAMVGRLRIAALLEGARGRPSVDAAALATVVASFSQLAVELGDHLEAVDVNPLVVHPGGVVAVDVLVVPR